MFTSYIQCVNIITNYSLNYNNFKEVQMVLIKLFVDKYNGR